MCNVNIKCDGGREEYILIRSHLSANVTNGNGEGQLETNNIYFQTCTTPLHSGYLQIEVTIKNIYTML